MYVTPEGRIGIGTTSPGFPLDVRATGVQYNTGSGSVSGNSTTLTSIPPGGVSYLTLGYFPTSSFRSIIQTNLTITSQYSYTTITSTTIGFNVSIHAENDILIGGSFVTYSDKRIKKNIRDINGNTALSQLRKIQPKIYNYIDEISKTGEIYGFIAQDIKDVILHSTGITVNYIPNFYCKGDIQVINESNHIYEITSENELIFEKILDYKGNEVTDYNIQICDDKNNKYICSVINIIDSKKIIVKCEKEYILSTIEEYKNKVFIFGQEINDFHNLDKDVIFTVATAALQEVDRQQQADKARIAELENHVSNLEAKVSEQQSLINDILERLKSNGM